MASTDKLVYFPQLKRYDTKIKATYVAQEFKTGSSTVKKVLSDNNLTDDLVAKINSAGTSSFSGAYADLTGKPTINGKEVTGTLTAAGLGLATPSDITTATADLVSEGVLDTKLGSYLTTSAASGTYITPTGVDDKISMATADFVTNTALNTTLSGYVTSGSFEMTVENKVDKSDLNNKLKDYATNDNVQEKIAAAVASAVTPRGTVAYANLPTPAKSLLGAMYNVSDAFTTDARFVEGAGKTYAAGANVYIVAVTSGSSTEYKFDVFMGFVDLSGYALKADFPAAATNDDIDAMFE